MSSPASQFTSNTPSRVTPEASHGAPPAKALLHTDDPTFQSTPSTHAGPSAWHVPEWIEKEFSSRTGLKRRSKWTRNLTTEEEELSAEVASRLASRLALDHVFVLYPDVDTPFVDGVDVVQRLLPYHIFQLPRDDLSTPILPDVKGKRRATDQDLFNEIKDTKFALECFKRRKALQDRFRRVRLRTGKRDAPDGQAYTLAQLVVDADRAEVTSLNAELRNARLTLDKIQREKLVTPRQSFYSTAAPPQTYYRNHQYTYAQPYGTVLQAGTSLSVTTPSAHSTTVASMNHTPVPTGAIPVQLPVGSLPALHALGIVPVSATSLPPSDQPQPPAVLRGTTANGTMLSLEINVSLLQQAQMGGLAMVLNSLMSRGVSADNPPVSSITSNTDPH